MKKVIIPLFALLLSGSYVNSQVLKATNDGNFEVVAAEKTVNINWETSYQEALRKSKAENKPILVYFTGSDWCGPCIKLKKELFQTDEFKNFSEDNLILYKADFPRNKDLVSKDMEKQNNQLQMKFKQRKFPTMIMVDANENSLGSKKGVYMTEYYYPFFKKVLREHYNK